MRRLWIEVAHHAHGIVVEYEDGSQCGKMLHDDGTLMTLPPSHAQLELGGTAYFCVEGEYIT